jgi:hypothetical protein
MGKRMLLTKQGDTLPSDLSARRVIEALDDEEFDFRTVQGLSEALDLPESTVQQVLDDHADLVRVSAVRSRNGEALYTLRSRPVTTRENLAVAQTAFEKSVS